MKILLNIETMILRLALISWSNDVNVNAYLDAVSRRKFTLVIKSVSNISKPMLGYVMHIKPDPKHRNQSDFLMLYLGTAVLNQDISKSYSSFSQFCIYWLRFYFIYLVAKYD